MRPMCFTCLDCLQIQYKEAAESYNIAMKQASSAWQHAGLDPLHVFRVLLHCNLAECF